MRIVCKPAEPVILSEWVWLHRRYFGLGLRIVSLSFGPSRANGARAVAACYFSNAKGFYR